MDRSLLDTDIFSEILKSIHPKVRTKAASYRAAYGRFTVSAITVMEIVRGLHKAGLEGRIRQFLDGLRNVELLSLDLRSSELAGRIYADLERTGQPIGRADPMIAGIAIRHGLTLVSGNVVHFQRIQGLGYDLKLDNWRD